MWLHVSAGGRALTIFHGVSSLASCILFISETYMRQPCSAGDKASRSICISVPSGFNPQLPIEYLLVEQALQPVFVCHYFLLLYLAINRVTYVFSLYALIDVFTVIPVYIDLYEMAYLLYTIWMGRASEDDGPRYGALNVFRVIRAIKIIRLVRMTHVWRAFGASTRTKRAEVRRPIQRSQARENQSQQIQLLSSVILLLILTTGLVQWLSLEVGWTTPDSDEPRTLLFHEALYYTIVTLSTVGYGEYVPHNTTGRLLMTLLVSLFMLFVPYQSAKFFELRRLVSSYRGAYTNAAEHIVITCDPMCPSVRNFLLEFFHPDHGFVVNMHVVVMCPSEPTSVMREVLLDFGDVTYLNGDVLTTHDMERARLDTASGCFLLADTSAASPNEADALTVMRAIALHHYRPKLRKVVQLLNPKLKVHVTAVGIPEHFVVCVEELQLALAAQGALMPGLSALVTNLVTSISISDQQYATAADWFAKYLRGLDNEIYAEALPPAFHGRSFNAAVRVVSNASSRAFGDEHPIVLLGVVTAETMSVLLAPGKYYEIQDHGKNEPAPSLSPRQASRRHRRLLLLTASADLLLLTCFCCCC
jgi:voltage-gated potassium channel